jgi:nucleoside-diphosphate-sugar epimerase
VAVERSLDLLEAEHPALRVVRLRPGLIFKSQAATEIRRLFAGPFLPRVLLARRLVPFVPDLPELRFQAVHSDDVGDAYRRAVIGDVRGAFNIAADPVLDPGELARVLRARRLHVSAKVLRGLADATFRLHLQPSEPGWLDMALQVPLMDTERARRELSWRPQHTSVQALTELIDGIGAGSGYDTPPLARETSGPGRARELLTGLGSRP